MLANLDRKLHEQATKLKRNKDKKQTYASKVEVQRKEKLDRRIITADHDIKVKMDKKLKRDRVASARA